MRKTSSLLPAVLLLCVASGYAASSRAPYASQFHVNHKPRPSAATARKAGVPKNPTHLNQQTAGTAKTQGQGKAPVRYANSQTSASPTSLGLVSATQIPAGGYNNGYPAYLGDFNGDGKMDIMGPEETDTADVMAVVLSKGNGTFSAPVLTTVSNSFYPMVVGDLNGDGKDDVIEVYPDSPSTATVWLSNGDGTFKQGNTYPISPAGLQGGVLTDVNGDGKLDILAVDSQTPGLVRTLLGNGDGTFQPATSVTLPSAAPYDLVFADYNGDGKVDFAGLDSNEQVNVYLQEGGNFVMTGTPLTDSDSTYSVDGIAEGDLMGDGKPAIVTVTCDGADENTVTVYPNNGDGSFATGVHYDATASSGSAPANNCAYAATVVDVNGDGKADILVSTGYGGDVAVLLSNGDGTVKVPNVAYATGGSPYVAPLVADFNGDGLPDIMQPDYFYSYAYLQGYGDGTFRAGVDYYTPITSDNWPYNYSIATADFNGDGIPDFVVGAEGFGQEGITVFLSRGDGSLMPGVNYGTSDTLYNVAVADFNGDGKADIVAVDYDNNFVQIFTGKGDGTFTAGPTYSTGGDYPWQVVTGDFNHDGYPDVAVANYNSYNVGVLLNDGTGNLGTVVNYATSWYGFGLAAGDVNGDGYTDLLQTLGYDDENYVAVFLGNSDNSGTFQSPSYVYLQNGSTYYYGVKYITLADFNGDGKLDLAASIAYDDTDGLVVALGNGDGTFGTPNLYSTTNQDYSVVGYDPYPEYVQAADMNGDGIPDLVYTNYYYGTVGVLLGNGDGSFGLPSEYPAGTSAYDFAVADVNGDGAPDVVTANNYSAGVTVLLNANGSGEKPDFAVTASTMSATVKAGSSATYDLTLTGKNAYESAITLTCSGLPAKAKCSFSPATVTTAGNEPQATVLTITTTAATTTTSALIPASGAGSNLNSGNGLLLASLSGIGLFGLVLAVGTKKQYPGRRVLAVLPATLLLGLMFTLVGCSGTSTPGTTTTTTTTTTVAGTPAGTYTVKVTAAGSGSSAPAHSMNLTLVVE
jgi:hypothetical protein